MNDENMLNFWYLKDFNHKDYGFRTHSNYSLSRNKLSENISNYK